MEFFEALIGCAIKSYQNSYELSKRAELSKTLSKEISKEKTTSSIEPLKNTISSKSISSLHANQQSPTKQTTDGEDSSQTRINKESIEQETCNSPIKQEQTIIVNDGVTESNEPKNVDDIRNWVEINNIFFSKFFPAASQFEIISQIANKAL